jgi:cell division protein FtsQ
MLWEDEPPAQVRVRRTQSAAEDAPLPGRVRRGRPGMPLDMEAEMEADLDGDMGNLDGEERSRSPRRFNAHEPKGRWWKPAGKIGRIFLALAALAVLSGLTASALMLRNLLERDARFRIDGAANIQAAGLTEVTRAEMLPVFGEDIGRNVFFVPLDERRKQLEALPWIESATVMRLLPDQIRINVVERKPVAFTRQGAEIGLVDPDGVLLTMPAAAMARHHYSFPVISGIDRGDPAASRKARMAVYLRLMSDLDSNGHDYSQQVSEIDLTDPEDARILMPAQGADILAHFGEDHFLERYERYQAHIAEWRQQYPHLAAVDLRYDTQVVLQMASGKEASDLETSGPDASGPGASGPDASGSDASGPAASKPDASAAKPAAGAPVAPASGDAPKPRPSGSGSAARHKTPEAKKKRAWSPRAPLTPAWNNAETLARPAHAAAPGE